MRHLFKVERIDELIDRELSLQIRLVAEDEKRDAFQSRLLQQQLQLLSRDWQSVPVSRVDDEAGRVSEWVRARARWPTHTMAFTPRQYLSHMERNLG